MAAISPMMFIGHDPFRESCPDNAFRSVLSTAMQGIPRPASVLLLSCEMVTSGARVRTLASHAGDCNLLSELQKNISGIQFIEDPDLQPDTWAMTVLELMFPDMDIPIHLMSIDDNLDPLNHYFLGKELRYLREKGVLIIALGNIVHNLSAASPECAAVPPDWAVHFGKKVKQHLKERNFMTLVVHFHLGPDARMSITEADHYMPLVYLLGAAGKKERLKPFYEGFRHGTTSLDSFRIG
jgi:4,5-DOPA dioxygenase extradiol